MLSVQFIGINRIYIVRNISDFYFSYCKLRCGKSFRSIETKVIYENNKIYIKVAKLEVWKEMFIFAKYIYCIYKVLFKLYNELFRYFKNGYIGTMSFTTSLKTLLSETLSKSSLLDLVYRILDILLLTPPFALVFKQEYIVIEDKSFEQDNIMIINGYIHIKVKI